MRIPQQGTEFAKQLAADDAAGKVGKVRLPPVEWCLWQYCVVGAAEECHNLCAASAAGAEEPLHGDCAGV